MLYNGALDLSCNHLGIIHALEANTWNGRLFAIFSFFFSYIKYNYISFNIPWSDAIRSVTRFNGDVVGQHYKLENLTLFIIRDAGQI